MYKWFFFKMFFNQPQNVFLINRKMFYDSTYHVIKLQAYSRRSRIAQNLVRSDSPWFSRINKLDIRSDFVWEMNQEKRFSMIFSS
jgi:hypothetical protein